MRFDTKLIEILKLLNSFFREKNIRYAIIGAQVPRLIIEVPVGSDHRPTRDIDITLPAESWEDFNGIKKELLALGFEEDAFELRFVYRGMRLDIVPYIKNNICDGFLELPVSGRTINILGFDRLLNSTREIKISSDLYIPVVPLHILVFTKILAFLDRGLSQNIIKDIEDIVFIFQNYESLNLSERRFDTSIPGDINYEDRGAYLIGIDLKQYVQEQEREYVNTFLEYFQDEFSETVQRVSGFSPTKRKENFRLFDAFGRGFGL